MTSEKLHWKNNALKMVLEQEKSLIIVWWAKRVEYRFANRISSATSYHDWSNNIQNINILMQFS